MTDLYNIERFKTGVWTPLLLPTMPKDEATRLMNQILEEQEGNYSLRIVPARMHP